MRNQILLIGLILKLLVINLTYSAHAQECDPAINYIEAGDTSYSQGEYQQAFDAYSCAIQLQQGGDTAYNWRGNIATILKDYSTATADYTQAIVLSPENAFYYNNRGWVYYLEGEYELALDDFNRAISLNQNLAYAYNNRGLIYMNNQDYSLALTDFDRAIELEIEPLTWATANREEAINALYPPAQGIFVMSDDPSNDPKFKAAYQAGIEAYTVGDYTTAISAFQDAIALYTGSANVYYSLGYTYLVVQDYAKAVENFSRAIAIGERCSPVMRAYAYIQLGNYSAALQDYEQAVRSGGNRISFQHYLYGLSVYASLPDTPIDTPTLETLYSFFSEVSDAVPVKYGETMTFDVTARQGYRLTFSGKVNDKINITTSGTNEPDTVIALLDAQGQLVAFNDDNILGSAAILSGIELPADAIYTILVTYVGGDTVSVDVTVADS